MNYFVQREVISMGKVDVQLLGIEDTIKELRKFQGHKIAEAKKIIKETANKVKKEAKSNAPVLTGQTKASIGYKTYDGGLSIKIKPKKIANYKAHWLEYGTVKMPAKPFMSPAEKNAQREFDSKINQLVKEDTVI